MLADPQGFAYLNSMRILNVFKRTCQERWPMGMVRERERERERFRELHANNTTWWWWLWWRSPQSLSKVFYSGVFAYLTISFYPLLYLMIKFSLVVMILYKWNNKTLLPRQWGLEYTDCISCSGVRPPPKRCPGYEYEYAFIAITLRFTLNRSGSTY